MLERNKKEKKIFFSCKTFFSFFSWSLAIPKILETAFPTAVCELKKEWWNATINKYSLPLLNLTHNLIIIACYCFWFKKFSLFLGLSIRFSNFFLFVGLPMPFLAAISNAPHQKQSCALKFKTSSWILIELWSDIVHNFKLKTPSLMTCSLT